jgi:hypothetical protein
MVALGVFERELWEGGRWLALEFDAGERALSYKAGAREHGICKYNYC